MTFLFRTVAMLMAMLVLSNTVAAAEGKKTQAVVGAAAKKTERGGAAEKPAKPAIGASAGQMVSVAGGPFFMGCNESVDRECDGDEKPGQTVEVAPFKIDKTEVTVDQYQQCVSAGACSSVGLSMPFHEHQDQPELAEFCNWQRAGRGNHPINCLSWSQAVAFCTWAGKRLPTEAEWEKAARGTDGRKYPWGNAGYDAGKRVANIADESLKRRFPKWEWPIATGYDDGWVGTASVGSFPAGASPSGALDMMGNVWEFTADVVEDNAADRGAGWGEEPRRARASNRGKNPLEDRFPGIGFRCVQ